MVKKKTSKMSAKARMAYVRSFIGKKKGKHGGSLKEQMDYVRSFRGKKKKTGGKFPKGTLSQWRAKASSGSASERAKYKRAIENWNKLMGNASFKAKWNSNKIRRGGALEDGVNYRDLIGMYQNRAFGMGLGGNSGGAIRAGAIRAGAIRAGMLGAKGKKYYKPFLRGGKFMPWEEGYMLQQMPKKQRDNIMNFYKKSEPKRYAELKRRGGAIPVAGGMTPKMAKKFEQIYKRHVRQGAGITKRDLYRGAGKQNSLFFTRNRMLQRQRKKPMTISAPSDEMVQLYRNLYKRSGIHPENMIDPIVRNDRLKGGNVFKKIGKAVAKPIKFIKKHKIASTVANFIPGPVGVAARIGAKALGAGLIEEAGLNGRGHPEYIYH